MKKFIFLLVFSLVAVGAGCIIFIKSQPPLVINGYKSFGEHKEISVIEIENTGMKELHIQHVIVNDGVPSDVKLMVSRGETFELTMPSDPTITVHGIKQIKLFPSKYIDRKAVGQQPQHYGLKIEAAAIDKIMIHYNYLNIPFTLTANLENVE